MSTAIQSSVDYSKFKTIRGNRDINKAHINRLVGAYKENTEAIKYNPILVNEDWQVIDGQHRLEALKILELPVYFIEHTGLKLEDAQKLNSLVKTWTPKDYAHSYAENGSTDYKVYLNVVENYPFGHNIIVAYLAGSGVFPTVTMFRNGLFRVGDLKDAEKNLGRLMECQEYYVDYKRKGFAEAILVALNTPKFDWKWFLTRLETPFAKQTLLPFDSKGAYLRAIEEIYNYNCLSNKQIYFSTKVM